MNSATGATASPSPASSLRGVHLGVREDLEITRHVFRNEVHYVLRDPLTFQNHRLSLADYTVFVHLRAERALGAVFDALVNAGHLAQEDEERFYQFVVQLHRLGFLRLPIVDDKALYQRYRARQRHRRLQQALGFLFLRVPLWNPDAFLSRTVQWARPLFTPYAFVGWLALCIAAGVIAWRQADQLAEPLSGLLVSANLPLLCATLVVLKAIHEFGHAYACKKYGGHVPEMGAYFILFTPCAYVDATACWGFPRRMHRVIVCAAGMYVESIVAAIAVFVWATTGPGLVNAIAYNVIFLAGVVTVAFNINPLLRYDGYYILSDLLEIPNLRQRSADYVRQVLKRVFLGICAGNEAGSPWLRAILLAFGGAAGAYRMVLMVAITAVIAAKLGLTGLVIGGLMLGGAAIRLIGSLLRYLWQSPETAPVRARAVGFALIAFPVLPAALFWLPLPGSVKAAGVVSAEHEMVLRPTVAGVVRSVAARPGQIVEEGQLLLQLDHPGPRQAELEARAGIESGELRTDAFRSMDAARAAQEEARASASRAALAKALEDQDRLALRAGFPGRVVSMLNATDAGRYLKIGEPAGLIVSGQWRVRVLASEDQIARSTVKVGDRIEFRAAGGALGVPAEVLSIAPAGSRVVNAEVLTQKGTQDVPVDSSSNAALQPYFEIVLGVQEAGDDLIYGMTGYARLPGASEPLGKTLGRRLMRLWDKLMQS